MKLYKIYSYANSYLGSVYLKDGKVQISSPTENQTSELSAIINSIQEEGLYITKSKNNVTVATPKKAIDDEYMILLMEKLVRNLLLVKEVESSSPDDKMI